MKTEKTSQYKRLSLPEIELIYVMRSEGRKIREISRKVNRGVQTVHNVLKGYRHTYGICWRKSSAFDKALHVYREIKSNRKRQGRKKIVSNPAIEEHVIKRLVDDQWSPEQIAANIEADIGKKISARTIYTFTKKCRPDLKQYLFEKGKPRRQRVVHRRGTFKQAAPTKRSIHEREALKLLGEWEGDTIITRRNGKKAILSLRERTLRKRYYFLIPDLKSATVLAVLIPFLQSLPPHLRRSITLDNGVEFSSTEMMKLEALFPGFKVYYCDPYKSWQKGSVENSNRDLRWYYPKGTDFNDVTKEELKLVQDKINRKPMKCLLNKSAEQAFNESLLSVAA
jgi:IS30 family transposase